MRSSNTGPLLLAAGYARKHNPAVGGLAGTPGIFAAMQLLGYCTKLAASIEPAFRAASVDPVAALRQG